MTDRNEHAAADVVDRALAALRDAPVPDGPPPQVLASTVEALQSLTGLDTRRPRDRRKFMLRLTRYGGLAAAAALLLALTASFWLMDRGATPAFAAVVENVKKAKSVTFVTRMKSPSQPAGLEQKWYIQGGRLRMDIPGTDRSRRDGLPVLLTLIVDPKEKKALEIDYARKTAQWIAPADKKRWDEVTKGFSNPVEQLRKLKGEDAVRAGEERLDGRQTDVYRLKKFAFLGERGEAPKGEVGKMWVDRQTGLPVRIVLNTSPPGEKRPTTMTFEQFTWNQPLDADLFKPEVPRGFTVKEK